jgi:glutathione-regulated potassium-efflux system ancillary protein KefC/glutathione-regulated potassium-efflux system protein KefB
MNQLLIGALIYLAAAVISAPIAKRLGLGSVLGFLIAGALIGPSVLNIAGQSHDIMHFAELGVIVMLFLVGLELEPSRLWTLRKQIFGLGLLQVVFCASLIGAASLLVSSGWRESLAIGLTLALSSTAIVLQTFAEKGLLKTPVGQATFSVLLFQDIAVIPILALLPLIAPAAAGGDGGHSASLVDHLPAWQRGLLSVAVVAGILLAGRYLTRPLFRIIANTRAREIFVALALLLVVGITLLMGLVGLSPALGTFLAGVVLAESEYKHELEMDLEPFKGILLATFFIAVGAGMDFSLFAKQPLLLASGVLGLITIKLLVHFALAKLFGMPTPERSRFSFALAQGSEFGFVLISFTAGLGLLKPPVPALLTAVVATSMALAPIMMLLDERLLQPRFASGAFRREADEIHHDGVDAIIAGHGRFGMTVGRLLTAQGVRTAVLDVDSTQVDSLRRFGFHVFYGDALRMDLLEAAGAREAKLLIITLDDRQKATELVRIAKHNYPNLKLLVRTYDRAHAYEVLREGVEDVYREVFGSSVDMGRDALIHLGKHPYEAERASLLFRKYDDGMMRKSALHAGDQEKLIDIAKQARAEIERVLSGDRQDQKPEGETAWHTDDSKRT